MIYIFITVNIFRNDGIFDLVQAKQVQMNYEQIYYIVTLNVSLNIIFDKCADEKKVQIQTISICIDVYYVHLSWRQMDREIYGE